MPQLIQSNWNSIMLLYFIVYLINKHAVDAFSSVVIQIHINTVEFKINHLFDHLKVMQFFFKTVHNYLHMYVDENCIEKSVCHLPKIFCCRPSK